VCSGVLRLVEELVVPGALKPLPVLYVLASKVSVVDVGEDTTTFLVTIVLVVVWGWFSCIVESLATTVRAGIVTEWVWAVPAEAAPEVTAVAVVVSIAATWAAV
jgi:hypothetical protein